jgi:glycosyltransferase involved in cell wall biosynthesis
MTRVLLVSPTAVPGGAERALASLAGLLPGLGFEPHAVVLQEGPLEEWLRRVQCPAVVLPAGRTRHLLRTARVVSRLRGIALREQVQVVVSNQSKGHFYGGLAALAARVPAVWWQQGIPGPNRIELAARFVPSVAVVCSSDAAVSSQARLTPGRRIEKIHLGVPVQTVAARIGSGEAIRREVGWQGPVVGIVGRLQPWKGQDVFLRAAAIVARAAPNVRFAVVGGAILGWEGSYPDDLRRLAGELGITDKVHFAGHQADVVPWFDALDVVVHASFGEPFGLVLLEAMALGKPLVAAADGGPLEIVEDGVSGLLVRPGDPERLASAVLRILRERRLAESLSAGSRVRAEQFSEQRMAAAFALLLSDIVGRSPDREVTQRPVSAPENSDG